MNDQITNEVDSNSLSLKDFFYKYISYIPLFILSVALAWVVSFIYLRYTTPIYSAGGSLLIKTGNNQKGSDMFENIFNSGGSQNILSEMEVLKSRSLMRRVVKSLHLETSYYSKGKLRSINIYKISPFILEVLEIDSTQSFTLNIKFSDRTTFRINERDEDFKLGQLFKTGNGLFRLKPTHIGTIGKEYQVMWQPSDLAASSLAGGIAVVPKTQGTGILVLSTQTTSPDLGADVINQLMIEYDSASIEDKNITILQTLKFIDDRMEKLEVQLDTVEKRLLAYRLANNLIDEDFQTNFYFSKYSAFDAQTIEQQAQLNIVELVEDYVKDKQNAFNTVPSSLGLSDPTLNGLIAAYNQVQLERKKLVDADVPEGNILVQQRNAEIEKLRESLMENLANLKTSFHSFINNLQKRTSNVQSEIKALPEKIRNLLDIQRQKETKLAIYRILLEKREETGISGAATISNSKIVDKAYANRTPIKPDRKLVHIVAILVGLLLPALFIFLKEILNDKVSTRADIERITKASILGEIGHSFAENTLFVNKTNRSMVAEQFRIIRANLQYVLNKEEKPVILVSSSFSGEGKSFITVNMGAVMALAGKKTVILEFDIRKPKLLASLNIPKGTGITNYLLGQAKAEDLPTLVPGQENLYIIGCGPIPPNPSELLLDSGVKDLFDYLEQNFDVIIIDTAPVGMVSDAVTLGKFANCSLYIVRENHTYKKQIHLLDEFYREAKLPKVSIVLNDVKMKAGYGYYGSGKYGYGRGYGSGYYEEEAQRPPLYKRILSRLGIKKVRKKK